MAGAANGNEQVPLASEIDSLDHIVVAGAAGDERRPPVDRGVEHGARAVVSLIVRQDQVTSKAGFQLVDSGRRDHCAALLSLHHAI